MDASSQHQHDRDHHSQQSASTAYLNTGSCYVPGHNLYACHCTNSKSHVAFTDLIPPEFIGDDFYCETGSRTAYAKTPCGTTRGVVGTPVAVKGRENRGSSRTYPSLLYQ